MGLPDIVIEFTKKAVASIKVGAGGIVGIIIKDAKNHGVLELKGIEDIPSTGSNALKKENVAYIERAFLGSPKKVIVYVLPVSAENYLEAFKYFGTVNVNYLCGAPDIAPDESTALATWVANIRKNTPKRPCVVLPNKPFDNKAIINFSVVNYAEKDQIMVGDKGYTEAEYCSRIAGLLAGMDLKISATYKPLAEVTGIPVADRDNVSEAIDAGKLTLYNDGDRIVIARGVNSLVTTNQVETEDLQKIKILAIQDLIETDIYSTINKSYIGNYTNSYDNKCLLITAIKSYLQKLENKGYLKKGYSSIEINLVKQRLYLEGIGIDTSKMSEQELKEANTGSQVFLKGKVSILDAIEDVDITINKE